MAEGGITEHAGFVGAAEMRSRADCGISSTNDFSVTPRAFGKSESAEYPTVRKQKVRVKSKRWGAAAGYCCYIALFMTEQIPRNVGVMLHAF